jgi:hypothetical protein
LRNAYIHQCNGISGSIIGIEQGNDKRGRQHMYGCGRINNIRVGYVRVQLQRQKSWDDGVGGKVSQTEAAIAKSHWE